MSSFQEALDTVTHSVTFEINGVLRTRQLSEEDRISGALELLSREGDRQRRAALAKGIDRQIKRSNANRFDAIAVLEAKLADLRNAGQV